MKAKLHQAKNLSIYAANKRRAVILAVRLDGDTNASSMVAETRDLAQAAGFVVEDIIHANRRTADRRTCIGKGKVTELQNCLEYHQAQVMLVTRTLTDSQHANLREELNCELLDYSGLILTIFAKRATTTEGKLQVELAQEIYGQAKLKGAWDHLERQRGGLGATGGPGERQLELDRRQVAKRINRLRKRLAQRHTHTQLIAARRQNSVPKITLVGYTNAGKSTLFAKLTKHDVPASKRLFETLGTTTKKLYVGGQHHVVLSDTVGFIRNLPHELVEAFRSTLQEAVVADLLLIVIDASDADQTNKLDTVKTTLASIGADTIPRMLVYNKMDQCASPILSCDGQWDKIAPLTVSALTGSGIDKIRACLRDHFSL